MIKPRLVHTCARVAVLATAVVVLAAGSAFAASVITTDESGGSTPPDPNSDGQTGWNPVNPCTVGLNGNIYTFLTCLATYIDPTFLCRFRPTERPSGGGIEDLDVSTADPCAGPNERGDFHVSFIGSPPIGLSIIRNDGGEPEKLTFSENDPNIQWTTVQVDRPGLVAKIAEISERPEGGSVSLWIGHSEDSITVPTTSVEQSPSAIEDANQAILAAIQERGFAAWRSEGYFFVVPPEESQIESSGDSSELSTGHSSNAGIRSLSFRSKDKGIRKSDLQLLPPALAGI